MRDASHAPRGRLRLTAPLTFGVIALAPALNDFAARHDGIELDVSFSDRVASLVDEGFDMAVRVGPSSDSSLIARKLCDVRILVVGAPDYLKRRGRPLTPQDLAGHDCIIDSNFREPGRWPFQQGGKPVAVPVAGRIRYANAQACLAAAESGLGLTCVPGFVADDAIRAGRVRQVLAEHEPPPYPVHAIYPHSRHLAGKLRLLVDFLIDRYRDSPAPDAGDP